jgi:signal recognition particle receptor subunit beta
VPFVVGVNCFDGYARHNARDVREALVVPDEVPVVLCDARHRGSVKTVLVLLVEEALRRARQALAMAAT